ncbi:MAG TPA: cytochrome c oxidase subunit 3 [Terracidiphilus sp.]|jgi:cytochrome c oxidase subunit 3/cytochrome o ubiquinol oxidase subunit 3
MATVPLQHGNRDTEWKLPARGTVAMASLITAESSIFTIFVVAYLYYLGTDVQGPHPKDVLEVPWFYSACLLSSSFFIWLAEHAIDRAKMAAFRLWWAVTILLGLIFLYGTAVEWHKLIVEDHLTISTNLFGTTYYSLVGLHASHVVVGLLMMLFVMIFSLMGAVGPQHAYRVKTLALYWHFVDAVWVVVFTVVYVVGR